ncbi:PAS domain-containing protein [Oscillatoria laete-virens NRMC-F 0139]|nr:PAS domain-containing protein [Oscillatoria laete-virens]MDL5053640.1 PAS domain-containing protein [Oscillatoria laete-virens NRMC-F 0139]
MNIFKDQDLMEGLLEKSGYAVVVTTPEGKVEWVNDTFTTMCGYELGELQGQKPGKLLQGELSDPEMAAKMSRAIRAGKSCSVEIINYHKDGHAYWVAIDIVPLCNRKGKIKHFLALEKEVTDRKTIEMEKEKTIVELYSALLHKATPDHRV